ncbi:MAG: stress response translation initiation inhibitor YciH [Candidatus Omnitrophota bacterium]
MGQGIVYSTGEGRMCPDCAKAVAQCECAGIRREAVPGTSGVVRVQYETHGRKGKRVTVIRGLPLSQSSLVQLAKKFKQQFGTGGTVQEQAIEIQGDHSGQIKQELKNQGYTVK